MIITKESLLSHDTIYIFGYGSLIWKPDIEYTKRFIAYLSGHERRFWQGSPHHRGNVQKPGRVLTLKQSPGGRVWGVVYEVKGKDKIKTACDRLYVREQSIGCYDMKMLPVYSKDSAAFHGKPIPAIIYYATPHNPNYTGDEGEEKIAKIIATSHGVSGHNIEYLFRLVDFMRESLPNELEPHLYTLDSLVRTKVGLCCKTPLSWRLLLQCDDRFRRIVGSGKENVRRTLSSEDEQNKSSMAVCT